MQTPDAFDRKILSELQRNGRLSIAELSERVGLSASPCWRRVRMLEEAGVIRGYTALVDPAALGLGLNVFVAATIDLHRAAEFEAAIMKRPEVLECFAMTGDQDYLLHVITADIEAFDRFLREDLIHMPGVDKVKSSFALKAIKSTSSLPVDVASRSEIP
ncbi:Lrp/AsnC family transcriptional regulator [Magnetospirillum sp. SS-4]|uniref:Lrp/AsnC family transcriptional regulator n=1 Tax=Magnetospirillum sp. SS-4 TaxID=2681465 RepID=UPI001383903E|nr:Lrp/AsnC family transcriptional regulator [Magnetospirillum sp. SS-4]CAA7613926.1 Bkd operon transcriptional regulator [Magnetospirillum sp. SS-4]